MGRHRKTVSPSTKRRWRSAKSRLPFALREPPSGGNSWNLNPEPLYVERRVRPTMEINAHVISGLDPGAIPGGSTKFPAGLSPGNCWREIWGADQHRQTSKGVAFSRPDPPLRVFKLNANDNFAEEIRL